MPNSSSVEPERLGEVKVGGGVGDVGRWSDGGDYEGRFRQSVLSNFDNGTISASAIRAITSKLGFRLPRSIPPMYVRSIFASQDREGGEGRE